MRLGDKEKDMRLTCLMLVVAMNSTGCAVIAPLLGIKEPPVEWPSQEELAAIQPVSNDVDKELNGQAALAAAGALQETIRLWSDQSLFEGCSTPALGLGAVVYQWKDYYYVNVTQRFDRCGSKRFRMLDWWESFAVSPEGRVLARQPHGS
ncbi:hypothetical protein [Melittangium boletus]|uniref:Uncharacterized protein n=1 Tax=Melittangium boletus DSM 14713 TaxID=1294270 RepID=A0A250IJ04_9BACT|nr:hypothetical protein [Melittangium boletus]ATB31127.1 hypothetical protein MEBOL_004589 [Melittangium boletus DSM 14713]